MSAPPPFLRPANAEAASVICCLILSLVESYLRASADMMTSSSGCGRQTRKLFFLSWLNSWNLAQLAPRQGVAEGEEISISLARWNILDHSTSSRYCIDKR